MAIHRDGETFSPRKIIANNATMTNIRLPRGDNRLMSSFDSAPNQNIVEMR